MLRFVAEAAALVTGISKLARCGGPFLHEAYRRAGTCIAELKLLQQSLADGGAARRHCVMGMIRAQQGTPQEAVAEFRKAAELDACGFWRLKALEQIDALEVRAAEE
jgi:hypothetical protein